MAGSARLHVTGTLNHDLVALAGEDIAAAIPIGEDNAICVPSCSGLTRASCAATPPLPNRTQCLSQLVLGSSSRMRSRESTRVGITSIRLAIAPHTRPCFAGLRQCAPQRPDIATPPSRSAIAFAAAFRDFRTLACCTTADGDSYSYRQTRHRNPRHRICEPCRGRHR
jgi:hypothetical protein